MFDVTRLNCLGAAGVTAIGLGILLTADHAIAQAPASNAPSSRPMAAAEPLWVDVTANAIGVTKFWTNKVEIADPRTRKVLGQVALPGRPVSLTISRDNQYAFASAQDDDTVYVVSIPDRKMAREIKTQKGSGPDPVQEVVLR